jgi:hypothetical protein
VVIQIYIIIIHSIMASSLPHKTCIVLFDCTCLPDIVCALLPFHPLLFASCSDGPFELPSQGRGENKRLPSRGMFKRCIDWYTLCFTHFPKLCLLALSPSRTLGSVDPLKLALRKCVCRRPWSMACVSSATPRVIFHVVLR